MTQDAEIFLSLIKAATGREDFTLPPDDADWKSIMKIAGFHFLSAIVSDGIDRCTDRPDFVLDKNVAEYALSQMLYFDNSYKKYVRTLCSLTEMLSRKGIKALLLKGYGLGINYPVPSHRACGDIDIWTFGEHRKADSLLRQNDNKVSNRYLRHSVTRLNGILIENHSSFLDTLGHPSNRKLERILEREASGSCIPHTITAVDGQTAGILLPSVRFSSLYILRHSACHFAAQGITLRHLLDWGFFVERHGSEIDWEWLESMAEESGMDKFMKCQNSICTDYLGFDREIFSGRLSDDKELTERMMDDIIHYGSHAKQKVPFPKNILKRYHIWRRNLWKHGMVYREKAAVTFLMQTIAHLRKPATLKI